MKKIKLEEDKYIINFNEKYYVVNEFTAELIEKYNTTNDIEKISKLLNITTRNAKKYYTNLKKQLNNCEYYEFNTVLPSPLKIQWKITSDCNLKCSHCYVGDVKGFKLSDDDLMKIADKIIKIGVMEVTITGGEALTVNSLYKIVEKFDNNGIKTLIFTNGILLKNFVKKIEGKINKKNLQFSISVDGNKNIHEKIRGNNTFEPTIDGIKYALQRGYDLLTNTVLSTINFLDIPNLYVFLDSMGVKKIQISNLVYAGRATSDMKLNKEQNEEFILKLKEVLNKNNITSQLLYAKMPDEQEFNSDIFIVSKESVDYLGKENWKCAAGVGKATIDMEGKVFCCPFLQNSYLGNILENDFIEVWDNEKRYKFLKFLMENNNNSRACIVVRKKGV